jgi:hypothetical protein
MGAIKQMQLLHNEFEAAVEDGDAELVLSLGPRIVNELRELTHALFLARREILYERTHVLTAEERVAIAWSINDQIEGGWQEHPVVKDVIADLRGLLERTK